MIKDFEKLRDITHALVDKAFNSYGDEGVNIDQKTNATHDEASGLVIPADTLTLTITLKGRRDGTGTD